MAETHFIAQIHGMQKNLKGLGCLLLCRAIKHLLDVLRPHSTENGGPLKVEHVVFVEGRGNLMIEYTSEGAGGK